MSTRRKSCDHDHWNIYPGNVVVCADCGETIDEDELLTLNPDAPIHVTQRCEPIKPLTWSMKDLT